MFIDYGVIVNPILPIDSPLMIAAFRKLPLSTFQELIQAGADPNYVTPDGQNVISKLIYAEQCYSDEVFEHLMENGFDLTILQEADLEIIASSTVVRVLT